jgi:hypothetical protein
VYSKVAAIELIVAYADNTANPTPVLDTYITAGVSGVTSSNLEIVNTTVASMIGTDVDTTIEIQDLINFQVADLDLIIAWADGSDIAPSVNNYVQAGTTGATTDNLNAINNAIQKLTGSQVNTPVAIQSVMDTTISAYTNALAIISTWTGEGDAQPSVSDYDDIGVNGVANTNLEEVNSVIATASETQSNTAAKIQSLIDVEVAAISIIANWTGDTTNSVEPSIENYTIIGVNGVGEHNLVMVNAVMADASFIESDTVAKIQTLINVKVSAIQLIADWANGSNTAPTVDNYADAGVIGVSSADLDIVNLTVQATTSSEADTTSEIQVLANTVVGSSSTAVAKIANWDGTADDTNSNVPTTLDYTNAGVSGVSENNLILVNVVIAEATVEDTNTTSEIQAIFDVKATAIIKI